MFMYDSQRTPLTSQYLTHFDRLFREANAQGSQKYAMVHNGTQWYTMVQIGTRKKQFSRTVKSCLLLVIVYTIASQYLIHFVNPMHRVHFFISHAIVRLPFRGLL